MKKILITGCSGLVGVHLVKETLERGDYVIGVDIRKSEDLPKSEYFKFLNVDLMSESVVKDLFETEKPDAVFNCFGIKGSPLKAKQQPVDFLYPSFKINTEIIHQCAKNNVWLVFLSSVGVYAPAETFYEDDVWRTLPSENDWFPSWSKRMGELLLGAYKKQYSYRKFTILRPANIFGEYDDFSGNGTVIASTIKKVYEAKDGDKITAWGNGTPQRDFVYAKDVASAVLESYKRKIADVVNVGSGESITIESMIKNIIEISGKNLTIEWDTTKPNGDMHRKMSTHRQGGHALLPKHSFKEGLRLTYEYYLRNYGKNPLNLDIDEFFEKGYYVGKVSEFIREDELEKHKEICNKIFELSKDKEDFKYRYEYRVPTTITDEETLNYVRSLKTPEEIEARRQFISENGWDTVQHWWELDTKSGEWMNILEYFREKIQRFLYKLYPDLKEWSTRNDDGITIYENGDFIEPHVDGQNPTRYCVVLIYLTPEKDYIDGGGKLILQDKGYYDEVIPTDVNFAILDFSKNNANHAVEAVKNDFKRFTYINFVSVGPFSIIPRYVGNKLVEKVWEPDEDTTYGKELENKPEEKQKII